MPSHVLGSFDSPFFISSSYSFIIKENLPWQKESESFLLKTWNESRFRTLQIAFSMTVNGRYDELENIIKQKRTPLTPTYMTSHSQ